jgi:hypothetical protein
MLADDFAVCAGCGHKIDNETMPDGTEADKQCSVLIYFGTQID